MELCWKIYLPSYLPDRMGDGMLAEPTRCVQDLPERVNAQGTIQSKDTERSLVVASVARNTVEHA